MKYMLVEAPMKSPSHTVLTAAPGGAVGVSQARCQSGVAHGQQLEGAAEGAAVGPRKIHGRTMMVIET